MSRDQALVLAAVYGFLTGPSGVAVLYWFVHTGRIKWIRVV